MKFFQTKLVGGIRFTRIGRVNLSWSIRRNRNGKRQRLTSLDRLVKQSVMHEFDANAFERSASANGFLNPYSIVAGLLAFLTWSLISLNTIPLLIP